MNGFKEFLVGFGRHLGLLCVVFRLFFGLGMEIGVCLTRYSNYSAKMKFNCDL